MSKIDPTVGRVVWFHPPTNSTKHGFEPHAVCAAQIARVLPNGRVNLGVLDGNGENHSMTDVPLIQEGDEKPANGYYAEWMPYQKSVAKGETAPVLHAQPTKAEKLSAPASESSPFSAAHTPVPTPSSAQNPSVAAPAPGAPAAKQGEGTAVSTTSQPTA